MSPRRNPPSALSASLRPDDEGWKLPEPITVELTALRTRLLPSLVEAAARNGETGAEDIALFEIARVYLKGGDLPDEHVHVAGIAQGDFLHAKGIVEDIYETLHAEVTVERTTDPLFHPGKAARTAAGVFGELHPRLLEGAWCAFELDLASLAAVSTEPVAYRDVITFPELRLDIAVVVPDEVEAGAIIAAAHEAAGDELREARVFDVYRGAPVPEGKKSVAFSVAFQSPERTLSDEDATRLRTAIVDTLAKRFGAELRAS
jgi:phenylalanyl-tRNA synthetase beta chain